LPVLRPSILRPASWQAQVEGILRHARSTIGNFDLVVFSPSPGSSGRLAAAELTSVNPVIEQRAIVRR
jgi:hypothetical protein